MATDSIKITKDITLDAMFLYLIRIDRQEAVLAIDENDAKLIVNSIATREIENMQKELNVKIFRQDLDDGRKVIISKQYVGYLYNSRVHKAMIIETVPVSVAKFNKEVE